MALCVLTPWKTIAVAAQLDTMDHTVNVRYYHLTNTTKSTSKGQEELP